MRAHLKIEKPHNSYPSRYPRSNQRVVASSILHKGADKGEIHHPLPLRELCQFEGQPVSLDSSLQSSTSVPWPQPPPRPTDLSPHRRRPHAGLWQRRPRVLSVSRRFHLRLNPLHPFFISGASSHGNWSLTVVKLRGMLSPRRQEKHQLKLQLNFLKLLKPYKKRSVLYSHTFFLRLKSNGCKYGFKLASFGRQWDKLEDKYAVTSLTFFALIALYGSAGMISAIDRLPLLPSIFELVGIGYTGWFAYRNLVFKPDREALIEKIKSIYSDIIGSS